MKSITIHGIDSQMDTLLRMKADNEGLSLNRTIKLLLSQALGLKVTENKNQYDEFAEFLGVWDRDEAEQFDRAMNEFKIIDEDEWQ